MTGKPHPTDALPMPETKLRFEVALTTLGERLDYTADQLRAERIAAYNLGRESMREEAAKKCNQYIDPNDGELSALDTRAVADACASEIRSIEL